MTNVTQGMNAQVDTWKTLISDYQTRAFRQSKTPARTGTLQMLINTHAALCAWQHDDLYGEAEWNAVCNRAAGAVLDAERWLMRQDAGWLAVLVCAEAVEVQA